MRIFSAAALVVSLLVLPQAYAAGSVESKTPRLMLIDEKDNLTYEPNLEQLSSSDSYQHAVVFMEKDAWLAAHKEFAFDDFIQQARGSGGWLPTDSVLLSKTTFYFSKAKCQDFTIDKQTSLAFLKMSDPSAKYEVKGLSVTIDKGLLIGKPVRTFAEYTPKTKATKGIMKDGESDRYLKLNPRGEIQPDLIVTSYTGRDEAGNLSSGARFINYYYQEKEGVLQISYQIAVFPVLAVKGAEAKGEPVVPLARRLQAETAGNRRQYFLTR